MQSNLAFKCYQVGCWNLYFDLFLRLQCCSCQLDAPESFFQATSFLISFSSFSKFDFLLARNFNNGSLQFHSTVCHTQTRNKLSGITHKLKFPFSNHTQSRAPIRPSRFNSQKNRASLNVTYGILS